MKEFEKFLTEQANRKQLTDFNPERLQRTAWKAALKWVLNHPDLIDHYMLDYVKEELLSE